jgi:hypothetical protein
VQRGGEVAMAQKPDGKSIRTERVTFTKPAAERIAKVVRTVEQGDRSGAALTFGAVPPQAMAASSVKFAYHTATTNWSVIGFTGATTTNNTKVIQFAFPTTTPFATALCVNHLSPIPLMTTVATAAISLQRVLVLKENGMWRLIGAQS